MKIEIRSPTRVDLAGGTLDLWPLYNFVGGAQTVNLAISIFTMVELEVYNSPEVKIESRDLPLSASFSSVNELMKDGRPHLRLYQLLCRYWKMDQGFRIVTASESPVGGGLGGSSSLMVSLLKAFAKAKSYEWGSVHDLVRVAHNLEAQLLMTPTGTQDYYPAASGGLNILSYNEKEIGQEVWQDHLEDLKDRFLVVYTGRSHHSGLNNFQVLTQSVEKNPGTLLALHELKKVSDEVADHCRHRRWERLSECFRREFEERLKLAPAFSSPEIESLNSIALRAGASAVKICGAGGGGCVMIWLEPSVRNQVREACQKAGFQVLAANPVSQPRLGVYNE